MKQYWTNFRVGARKYLGHPLIVFLVVCSSQTLDNANIAGFFTSLSAIQDKFDVSYSTASWTVSAYAVTFSSFILIFGRVSDILQHNSVYIWGLFALALFSLIGAVVDNIQALIVMRAFQGIAAAATIPPSYALLSHTFEGEALKSAFGGLTAVLILALGIGAIVGGAFDTTSLGYKGLLWVFFAWAAATGIMAFLVLEPIDTSKKKSAGNLKKLDYMGVFMMMSGSMLLVTGFTEAGEGWNSPKAYVPLVIGFLVLGLFFAWETLFFNGERGASIDLMIPKEMWQIKNFKIIPIISFFTYGWFFELYMLVPNFLQAVAGDTPIIAAVKYSIPQVGAALLAHILHMIIPSKLSAKAICTLGMSMSTIGTILITRSSDDLNHFYRFTLPGTLLASSGIILHFSNYLNLILLATPLEMQALVVGICLTLAQFGVALILAISSSILGDVTEDTSGKSEALISTSYINAMYLPMAFCIASLILIAVFLKNLKPEDQKISQHLRQTGVTDICKTKETDNCDVEEVSSVS